MSAPTPRIGYVVLSHRRPHQVHRLTSLLAEAPGATVALHHDPRGPALRRPDDGGGPVLVDPAPADWGTWGPVGALLRGLRLLHAQRPRVDWFVSLSGQDYPVRPLADFADRLGGLAANGAVSACRVPTGPGDVSHWRDRYCARWWRVPPGAGLGAVPARIPAWLNRHQDRVRLDTRTRSGAWIGVRSDRHPFGDVALYKGDFWSVLDRRCVEVLLGAAESSPLTPWFRRTFIPDEAWLHTVLRNEPGLALTDDVYHRAFFDPGAPHPRTLGPGDLDDITASGAFFVRKFDEAPRSALLDGFDELARAGTDPGGPGARAGVVLAHLDRSAGRPDRLEV